MTERRFGEESKKLSKDNQAASLEAVARVVVALKEGRPPDPAWASSQ